MNECTFRDFRKLCNLVANTHKYTDKTKIINNFINKYENNSRYLIIKMLLPHINSRIYHINDKQLIKIFSKILNHNSSDMYEDLEKGYIEDTVKTFFDNSNSDIIPIKKSILTLRDVDSFLNHLYKLTKEKEQTEFLKKVTSISTSNDIKCFILFIKNDLRIKAGTKCVLDALHKDAYKYFKNSQDLKLIFDNINNESIKNKITPMVSISPMLADVCKSMDNFKDIDNGLILEIKYDGERVQVHKNNNVYRYFSRNSKDVTPYKVKDFDNLLNESFKNAKNFILDSEIVLIDTVTNKFLPFGSLGKNKQNSFNNSSVCMFIFDCMYYNDDNIINENYLYRRKVLVNNIKEIKNKVMLSSVKVIKDIDTIKCAVETIINNGLEGVVIKYPNEKYIPGKRKWLKIKKDYINDGNMADSADLVVLGAYYGKGNRGGIMSIFLMGCYDEEIKKWKTVTKCSGHDESTLKDLQSIDMIKISKDGNKIPDWLVINKIHYPDFVVRDPKSSPVWEISGYEFTKSPSHTAGGISIRFPRCKIRDDKDWKSATNLKELKRLYSLSISRYN
ncbi:DNA ligase [Brazilian porcupinepox virus 1]|nr:DNA ligase [Brazilian porcupinepox virus 1]